MNKDKNPFELTESEKKAQIEDMWRKYEIDQYESNLYLQDDEELDPYEDLD